MLSAQFWGGHPANKVLGIGIIGAGGIVRRHAVEYASLPEFCRLIAVADIDISGANAAKREHGFAEAYGEYRELLARDDIRVVSVCTPPHVHSRIVIAALEAGKNVLCEKPMARTLEEADLEIEAAAQQKSQKFSCRFETLKARLRPATSQYRVDEYPRENFRVQGDSESGKAGTGVAPEPATKQIYVLPVTFAQQRLLALEQLDPTSTSHSVTWSIRMAGKLNADALEDALNEIVCRHEILRTTFGVIDGQPAQIVSPELRIPLVVVDMSPMPEPEQEAQVAAMKEAQTPVDLTNGPVLRAKLLRLAAADHWLLFTTHHIVFDAWSRRIFLTELANFYDAFCAERHSPLPELALQYGDYAVWQRNYLQGENFDKLLNYWKEQLAGAPAMLDLPTDRRRPSVRSFRGASRPFVIPRGLWEQVTHSARTSGVTPFMTLLAGFEVLLSRYSGQDDIVVEAPIANRHRSETEGLIGNFANTLALRIKLGGDPTFRELLERVKEISLGAYAYQDMPFELLVQELWPERSLSRDPLFQVLFSLQNAPRRSFELSGLQLKPLGGVTGTTAQFDIAVYLLVSADGLSGRIEYNADLFNAATIDRMLQHYMVLLEAALADPATHISQLPLLLPRNREINLHARLTPRVGSENRKNMVQPRNNVEATVLRVWQQLLGRDSIGVTDNFFEIGGHSLLAIRLIAQIENVTGKRLPVSTVFEGPTVEYLAGALMRLDESPNKLIVELQSGNAKPPFFGIVAPGARGFYTALATHLGKDQPFYRIQGTSPPPERRPYTAIEYENLAAEYIEAVKTAQPRGPYYLGGGCQGARIAFDMTRLLEARGEKVGLLAIFDTWAIENTRNRLLFVADYYSRRLMQFWGSTRREKLHALLRVLKHPFRRRGPSKHVVAVLWPGRDFVPAKCTGKITVFKVPKQRFYYIKDRFLGWRTRTTARVELELVDSSHGHLLREPYVGRLAEKLADSLGRAISSTAAFDRKRTGELVGSVDCHTR